MTENPTVSVVIAAYNRAEFLPAAIDSILAQGRPDCEVIVVDDGSTDNTREVLGRYHDRIRCFYQENRGPSAARNAGVTKARGRWIAIQDSDDLAAPDHLETLLGFVQKEPACGMVFANGAYLGGPEHNRETIIPKGRSRRLADKGVTLADLFDKSIFRLQASLISKELFLSAGGLDERLRICHDLDLAFRLYGLGSIAYVDKVVFYYRKHEGNITRDQETRLVENIRVIEKLLEVFPEAGKLLGRAKIVRRLAYRYYRLAKTRRKLGDRAGGKEAIRQAVALRPCFLKYRFYQLRFS